MKKLLYTMPILAVFVLTGCGHTVEENKSMVEQNKAEPVSKTDKITSLEEGDYIIDAEQSQIKWKGVMIGVKSHTGTITVKSGSLEVKDAMPSGGEVIVDMTTIVSDEDLASLVTHLKSEDFFSVEDYPESKLTINSFKQNDGGKYLIMADLEIKGIVEKIGFEAEIAQIDKDTIVLSSEFKIDRSKWNVRYGSDKFFDNLGDKVISDEIDYSIKLVAKKN